MISYRKSKPVGTLLKQGGARELLKMSSAFQNIRLS